MLLHPIMHIIATTITNAIEKTISPQTYAERRARERAEQHRVNMIMFKSLIVVAIIIFIALAVIGNSNMNQ